LSLLWIHVSVILNAVKSLIKGKFIRFVQDDKNLIN
jgi:hypothetical protein